MKINMNIKKNINKGTASNVKISFLYLLVIFCIQILLLFFEPLLKIGTFNVTQKISVIFIIDILLSSVIEEIIFRWYFINKLGKFSFLSIIISSIIFGIFHMDGWLIFYHIFCGFIFSILYDKTRELKYPIFVHFISNIILALI